ncbi:response regulator [Actinocrispum wychmicini]|uniref:DNA-binding NarL/FixJ family response regulator n=1 Tax=Actinocrispum wychmicini TaxID=1213861 RepID=A0A4V2S8T6_9PSEU|nr:response regulator transcription factor [Actinocrispum wychmicini]TCO65040.1 DNA-binding NarL/FixJ family response regulator [Actinocrispum wychmicini]
MIRVVLVDDQQLARAGLRMLCESTSDIEVVGEADNGRDAVTVATTAVPDVVLMDLRMPGMDGITATRRILEIRPATRVLVLTTFDDDDHVYPALTAGACGFLAKDVAPADLLDGIRKVVAGESPFSPAVLRRIVDRAMTATRPAPAQPDLTDRELDVLALLGAGMSNAQIGEELHVGVTTVKTHVANIMTKTRCDNRVRLAVLAVRLGLVV